MPGRRPSSSPTAGRSACSAWCARTAIRSPSSARVETLEADFERLRGVLDLPGAALGRRNVSVAPAGAERPWRSYYDGATRRLVEEIYAADLEFTGCGFDDAPATPPVAARPVRRRRGRTLPARLSRRLWALELRLEERIRGSAMLRRILRPLKRLRGFRA